MTTLLTASLLSALAIAGEPEPSVLTLDAESARVNVDLRSNVVEIGGDVLEGTCTEDRRAVPCEGGIQHVLLVDREGTPEHAFVGRAVKWSEDTVILSGDAMQYVSPRDAATGLWETTIYGIWGTTGTLLDAHVFTDVDGAAIWGTTGTLLEGETDRVTPVAIWGTGGTCIWGTTGTLFDGIWGTTGTLLGNDGTAVDGAAIWGTTGTLLGDGETPWLENLESTDLDVLLDEGLAEPVSESAALELALEEIPLEALCESFACD